MINSLLSASSRTAIMIQFTVFSSAFAFWILFCLLCSIVHAVPTESPSSDDRFDTSQSGLSSLLNSDQTHLDFWNEGDLQFQSNDFANGFAGTSSASAIEIEPDSSDLFDTTTTTFSLVGNNDPYLASTSYVNGDDATFQESEMAQIAVDAAASSCELGARDSELSIDVDVDVDVDRISRRDHRDFGDIIDFGKHDCPLGKEAACCASGRPETVYNSIRMRPGCTAWGIIETLINMGCPNRYRFCCSDVDIDSTGMDCDLIFPEDQLDRQRGGPSCGTPGS